MANGKKLTKAQKARKYRQKLENKILTIPVPWHRVWDKLSFAWEYVSQYPLDFWTLLAVWWRTLCEPWAKVASSGPVEFEGRNVVQQEEGEKKKKKRKRPTKEEKRRRKMSPENVSAELTPEPPSKVPVPASPLPEEQEQLQDDWEQSSKTPVHIATVPAFLIQDDEDDKWEDPLVEQPEHGWTTVRSRKVSRKKNGKAEPVVENVNDQEQKAQLTGKKRTKHVPKVWGNVQKKEPQLVEGQNIWLDWPVVKECYAVPAANAQEQDRTTYQIPEINTHTKEEKSAEEANIDAPVIVEAAKNVQEQVHLSEEHENAPRPHVEEQQTQLATTENAHAPVPNAVKNVQEQEEQSATEADHTAIHAQVDAPEIVRGEQTQPGKEKDDVSSTTLDVQEQETQSAKEEDNVEAQVSAAADEIVPEPETQSAQSQEDASPASIATPGSVQPGPESSTNSETIDKAPTASAPDCVSEQHTTEAPAPPPSRPGSPSAAESITSDSTIKLPEAPPLLVREDSGIDVSTPPPGPLASPKNGAAETKTSPQNGTVETTKASSVPQNKPIELKKGSRQRSTSGPLKRDDFRWSDEY